MFYNPAVLSARLAEMRAWNFEKSQLHVYIQNIALQTNDLGCWILNIFFLTGIIKLLCQIAPSKWWMETVIFLAFCNSRKDTIV